MSRSKVNVFSLKPLAVCQNQVLLSKEKKPTSVTACQILDLPQRWLDRDMLMQLYLVKEKLQGDLANLLDTIPRASVAFSGLMLTRGCLLRLY